MYIWNTGSYGLDSLIIYLLAVTWISDSISWNFALSFLLSSMTRSLSRTWLSKINHQEKDKDQCKVPVHFTFASVLQLLKKKRENWSWLKENIRHFKLSSAGNKYQFLLFSLRLPPSPTFSCLIFEGCCLTKKNSIKIQKGCTVLSYFSSSSFILFLLSFIYSWLPQPEFSEIPWLFHNKYCFFPDHFITCGNCVIVLCYLLSVFSSLNGSLQYINLNYMSNIFYIGCHFWWASEAY